MNTIENNTPVDIQVSISVTPVSRYSFYTPCFISENNDVERHIVVSTLKQVLDAGYESDSTAYLYCSLAFAQRQRVDNVVLVAKRSLESYIEAFSNSQTGEYYYITLESKEVEDVTSLADYFTSKQINKLIFYSKFEDVSSELKGYKNIVWWWSTDFWFWDSSSIVMWDSDLDMDLSIAQYPEAAWISRCANVFPSQMQWLEKELVGLTSEEESAVPDTDLDYGWEIANEQEVGWDDDSSAALQFAQEYDVRTSLIPEFTTPANYYSTVYDEEVSWGSGCTCNGEWIDNKVFDDWLMWAIQRNIWKLIKTSPKISATANGMEQIELKIKEVLQFGLKQQGIQSYKITNRQLSRVLRTSSFEFEYTRVHAIIGVVSVKGVVNV